MIFSKKNLRVHLNVSVLRYGQKIVQGLLVCFFLLGSPNALHAGVLSFVDTLFGEHAVSVADAYTNTQESTLNAQNMQLLRAAPHYDPNPIKGKTSPTIAGNALLPILGPTGTIANIEGIESNIILTYEVQEGDTLDKVARMFDISIETIQLANNLHEKSSLAVGQTLIILPFSGSLHTVVAQDTLPKIARKYQVSIEDITLHNVELTEETVLIPGEKILIPMLSHPRNGISSSQVIKDTGLSVSNTPKNENNFFIIPVVGGIRTQGLHGRNAVDIAHELGTPIRAAAAGKIIVSASSGWNYGYGNYVVIQHDNGTQTLYAHLKDVKILVGENVNQGQLIGTMGSTGRSTGPHVHFEVRGARNPF